MRLRHQTTLSSQSRGKNGGLAGQYHANSKGVWLITFKKASGQPRLEYADAVEEALCFGGGQSARKLDDERTMLYFAPRKKGSGCQL